MKHQKFFNTFANVSTNNDDDGKNDQEDVNNVTDIVQNTEDDDTIHSRPRPMYQQSYPSMEGTITFIKKLMEDTMKDTTCGGMEVLNHLHSIMLTMATNIHQICIKKNNTLHL